MSLLYQIDGGFRKKDLFVGLDFFFLKLRGCNMVLTRLSVAMPYELGKLHPSA